MGGNEFAVDLQVGDGEGETGERVRCFGRSRRRRREEQELIDEGAEVFSDGFLQLLSS